MPERTGYDRKMKGLLRQILGGDFSETLDTKIDYGAGAAKGRIDGSIAGRIAVEIETRTDKQIRGAVLDLICHRLAQKLLIVVPVHMTNETRTVAMCLNIMARFLQPENFRVVLFEPEEFSERIQTAVRELLASPS